MASLRGWAGSSGTKGQPDFRVRRGALFGGCRDGGRLRLSETGSAVLCTGLDLGTSQAVSGVITSGGWNFL